MFHSFLKRLSIYSIVVIYGVAASVFFHALGMDVVSGNHEVGCHPNLDQHISTSTVSESTVRDSDGETNNVDCFKDCFSDYAHTALNHKISYKKIIVDDLPCIDFLHHGYGRNPGSEHIGLDSKYQVTESNNEEIFIEEYIGITKQVE